MILKLEEIKKLAEKKYAKNASMKYFSHKKHIVLKCNLHKSLNVESLPVVSGRLVFFQFNKPLLSFLPAPIFLLEVSFHRSSNRSTFDNLTFIIGPHFSKFFVL